MIDYGKPPLDLGQYHPDVGEMMFYLYLPINIPSQEPAIPERLEIYRKIIARAATDYLTIEGANDDAHAYITAKTMFVEPGSPGNRPGWHCDGFGSNGDINYIWSDMNPTEFAIGDHFKITDDDSLSMKQMEEQARDAVIKTYPSCTLLRLDEGVIHRVGESVVKGVRSFLKITFSEHQFRNKGNSINYLLDYNWNMKPRGLERNLDHAA